jgi:hypothetical protein
MPLDGLAAERAVPETPASPHYGRVIDAVHGGVQG